MNENRHDLQMHYNDVVKAHKELNEFLAQYEFQAIPKYINRKLLVNKDYNLEKISTQFDKLTVKIDDANSDLYDTIYGIVEKELEQALFKVSQLFDEVTNTSRHYPNYDAIADSARENAQNWLDNITVDYPSFHYDLDDDYEVIAIYKDEMI